MFSEVMPVVASVIVGYLLGSVPVAVLVARSHGFDPRGVGDRNPGFWNMKEQLGWRAAVPVFAGDLLKGTAAGLAALLICALTDGPRLPSLYAAVAAAMIGHAWPVFARFRGGRSVLTFAGGMAVISPAAFALALVALVLVALVTRSFAIGARVGVFGLPVLELLFDPALQVAATGALMCLIGLRFGQAALADRG
ncbi:glycerol-3-phosphate acyltransferase [Nonomuraea soli]|uniref:Glycerol-3-phosphate acyltransferase n=1 Tax=Nonomuraea soli TaxID=1032476 RepID=A0A7W0HPF9_9ACTN|nr:glycerol-3-phosphate acyltransferase [Nonomuraea soli]MBA2890814.1 glycerol-3-phosphate acyltransferase PlsY [Nonomuraea soli]